MRVPNLIQTWETERYKFFPSTCYEQLMAMDDMNDSRSWTQCLRCNEELRFMDDKNE